MIKLVKWSGSFQEDGHRYFRADGKELQGVTGMLHRRIFKDTYNGVSEDVLKAAAERGTKIHSRIQLYDMSGMGTDMPEVANYALLKTQNKLECLASEYLVSDDDYIASAIDKVYHMDGDADNEVWLVDIKTTYNFQREYVAWQLSVYAFLFEMMNPNLAVKGVAGLWVREDARRGSICKFIPLERKQEDLVRELIRCDKEDVEFNVVTLPGYISENIDKLKFLTERISELTKEKEELTSFILEKMQEHKEKSIDSGVILFTRKEGGERRTFDSARFKTEHSEMYDEYVKVSKSAESLSIKIRE